MALIHYVFIYLLHLIHVFPSLFVVLQVFEWISEVNTGSHAPCSISFPCQLAKQVIITVYVQEVRQNWQSPKGEMTPFLFLSMSARTLKNKKLFRTELFRKKEESLGLKKPNWFQVAWLLGLQK